jgi:hypothetical protein
MRLAAREAERLGGWRSIVGIYLGWNGDPITGMGSWLSGWRYATHLTFWDRYQSAVAIGSARSIQDTIRAITNATKAPLQGMPESPLIFVGHSMGALILESAFLAQIKDPSRPLQYPATPGGAGGSYGQANYRSSVEVRLNDEPVAFPDLLLAINSAADSTFAREIEQMLSRGLTKRLTSPNVSYAAPLLVSITSSADAATGSDWRLGRQFDDLPSSLLRPAPYTDGHDPNIRTHDLLALGPHVCNPIPGVLDFQQDWHCLRRPRPPFETTPTFFFDLPVVLRHEVNGPIHMRYELQPLRPSPTLAWIFQVPPEIISDHNDIFNARSTLLMLAMMQVSGAVVSLATDIDSNFEPEPGDP